MTVLSSVGCNRRGVRKIRHYPRSDLQRATLTNTRLVPARPYVTPRAEDVLTAASSPGSVPSLPRIDRPRKPGGQNSNAQGKRAAVAMVMLSFGDLNSKPAPRSELLTSAKAFSACRLWTPRPAGRCGHSCV